MPEPGAALHEHVAATPLAPRLELFAGTLLHRHGSDATLRGLSSAAAQSLARLLASHPDPARQIEQRPELLERLAATSAHALRERAAELDALPRPRGRDLESFLDALRSFRSEETLCCAALDLGGKIAFETAAEFLSRVAETCVRWTLEEAAERARDGEIAVVGMGKIAGRELTYHSDLDLVFLYSEEGGPRAPAAIAQRLISYLSTMTATGVAYAVDARLRPSGRQGALVSSLCAFESYQREKAATWEHLVLMRARALAGPRAAADALQRTRDGVLRPARGVWCEIAEMRERIERERGASARGVVPYKTGAGGLMDVEFLAQGGSLERADAAEPLPSIARLLTSCASGPRVDALLQRHARLRLIEARVRQVHGRATESLRSSGELLPVVAELVEPGMSAADLLQEIDATRRRIRSAYTRVIEQGTIEALA